MKGLLKKAFKYLPYFLVGCFVGMQTAPISRTNPRVTGEIQAPAEVMSILERSCYDCHSNVTKWPAYSYVAPVSWFVVGHVNDGRRHLNFSTWTQQPESRRNHKLEEIVEEVGKGAMPMESYTLIHRGSILSESDKKTLHDWIESTGVLEKNDEQKDTQPENEAKK